MTAYNSSSRTFSATTLTVADMHQVRADILSDTAAAIPAAAASGLATKANVDSHGFLAASASAQINPTGNAPSTPNSYAQFSQQYTTSKADATTREFMHNLGMNVNMGGGDKVLSYRGVVVSPGQAANGGTWVDNTLLTMSAGTGATSGTLYEGDINNDAGHYGDAFGALGIFPSLVGSSAPNPVTLIGMGVTGIGLYRNTGGYTLDGVRIDPISGAGVNDYWNRGFTVIRGAKQYDFGSYSNSDSFISDQGGHTYGLNLSMGIYTGPAIMLRSSESEGIPNSGVVAWRNHINGSVNPTIYGGGTNLYLAAPSVFFNGAPLPQSDNSFTLGNSTLRWSALYAANATIQTSDERTKTNIAPIDTDRATSLLMTMKPITYTDLDAVDLVDGVVSTTQQKTGEDGHPLWIDTPAVDDSGAPVMETVTQKGVVTTFQKSTRSPVMETVDLTTKVPQKRPGRRLHMGFTTQSLGAAIKASAFGDLAVYMDPLIKDPFSTELQSYRPTELIPLLVAVIQDQEQRIAALEVSIRRVA